MEDIPVAPDATDIAIRSDGCIRIVVPPDEREASLRVIPPEPNTSVPGQLPKMEVFGSMIYPAGSYKLMPGTSFSIYAWTGGTVSVSGSDALKQSIYRATSTNYKAIAEFHCILHAAREAAQKATTAADRIGPRLVICGQRGTGKHTIMRTLANYAARFSWAPLVVDCSVESQTITVPGSIGVASWDLPWSIDEDVSNIIATPIGCGLTSVHSNVSGKSPETISAVYQHAVNRALDLINRKLHNNVNNVIAPSGAIVCLPALPRRQGAEQVINVIDQLEATHVLCLGDDYLLSQLQQRYGTAALSDGTADPHAAYIGGGGQTLLIESPTVGNAPHQRTEKQIREDQWRRCRLYFTGGAAISVQPRAIRKPHRWAEFYRFIEKGDRCLAERLRIEDLVMNNKIQNVVGMLYDLPAGSSDSALLTSSVLSFVHLREADATEITLWCTTPEEGLPGRPAIVLTDLMWPGI